MSIRIKCPACTKEFTAGKELEGRMVECGVCEEQFKVGDESIVREKKKYYPGEKRDALLDQFSRGANSPVTGNSANVNFQTAQYNNQAPNFNSTIPMAPSKLLSIVLGISVILSTAFLLYTGSRVNGFLTDILMDKRLILVGFITLVCVGLILHGAWRRMPIRGILLSLLFGGGVLALTWYLPVYETVPDYGDEEPRTTSVESVNRPMTPSKVLSEFKERIGYGPLEKAIIKSEIGSDKPYPVRGILVLNMKESAKFMVMNYLGRSTGVADRPACYPRKIKMDGGETLDGGIFVLENHTVDDVELEEVCSAFGEVDQGLSDPDLKLLVVFLKTDLFNEVSPELQERMIDSNDRAFFELNYKELNAIEFSRVKKAVARLGTVKPELHRKKIAKRLTTLLAESRADAKFEKNVCLALRNFYESGDGTEPIISREAQRQLREYNRISQDLIELLITVKSPQAEMITEISWKGNPISWEPTVELMGKSAVPMLLRGLQSGQPMIQKSSARLLRAVGSSANLPALRSALGSAAADVKSELNSTIEVLSRR